MNQKEGFHHIEKNHLFTHSIFQSAVFSAISILSISHNAQITLTKKFQVGVFMSTASSQEIKFTLCNLKNSISSNNIKVFLASLSKRHTTTTATLPD